MSTPATTMSPAQMVASYIKLRDHKKAADEEYRKSMERVNAAMEKLEAMLLQHLNEHGIDRIACEAGTVYRNTQVSATVKDRDQYLTWALKSKQLDALDVKANKSFVKEFVNNTGEVPPGVKFTQVHTVGVRRS